MTIANVGYVDCYIFQAGIFHKTSREFPIQTYGPINNPEKIAYCVKPYYDQVIITEESIGCSPQQAPKDC